MVIKETIDLQSGQKVVYHQFFSLCVYDNCAKQLHSWRDQTQMAFKYSLCNSGPSKTIVLPQTLPSKLP